MKLIDLFEKPLNGEWGTESGDSVVPVLRTTNFKNNGEIDYRNLVYRNIDQKKYGNKILKYGDTIIEKSGGGPKQPVGRVVFFDNHMDESIFFSNNFTSILRPQKGIYPKFAFYQLRYLYVRKEVLRYQNKTTGIINLKLKDYLNKTNVVEIEYNIQKKIADALDLAQSLIEKRKEQLVEMDRLIQSVFYEMFNKNKFSLVKLNDYVSHVSSGATPRGGSSVYKTSGVPFIRSQNILMNRIDYSDIAYIEKSTHDSMKRSQLYKNDILLNITGASIGRVAVYTGEDMKANTNQHVASIRIDQSHYNPFFLTYYMSTEHFQKKIESESSGGTRQALNYSQIKKFDIPKVPIELQNKFATIVEEIESQKKIMEQSLTEMENNFNALLQKAFKGELFSE